LNSYTNFYCLKTPNTRLNAVFMIIQGFALILAMSCHKKGKSSQGAPSGPSAAKSLSYQPATAATPIPQGNWHCRKGGLSITTYNDSNLNGQLDDSDDNITRRILCFEIDIACSNSDGGAVIPVIESKHTRPTPPVNPDIPKPSSCSKNSPSQHDNCGPHQNTPFQLSGSVPNFIDKTWDPLGIFPQPDGDVQCWMKGKPGDFPTVSADGKTITCIGDVPEDIKPYLSTLPKTAQDLFTYWLRNSCPGPTPEGIKSLPGNCKKMDLSKQWNEAFYDPDSFRNSHIMIPFAPPLDACSTATETVVASLPQIVQTGMIAQEKGALDQIAEGLAIIFPADSLSQIQDLIKDDVNPDLDFPESDLKLPPLKDPVCQRGGGVVPFLTLAQASGPTPCIQVPEQVNEPVGTFQYPGSLPSERIAQVRRKPDNAVEDPIYERISRGTSYAISPEEGSGYKDLSGREYVIRNIDGVVEGFYAKTLVPSVPNTNCAEAFAPVLTLRGTDDLWGVLRDTSPSGVGADYFARYLSLMASRLHDLTNDINNPCHILPVVTGHSLGGALSQEFAAAFSGLGGYIGKVITFNSAGIPEWINKRTEPSHIGLVRHYISNDDVVSMTGNTMLSGTYVRVKWSIDKWFNPIQFLIDKHTRINRSSEEGLAREEIIFPGIAVQNPVDDLGSKEFLYDPGPDGVKMRALVSTIPYGGTALVVILASRRTVEGARLTIGALLLLIEKLLRGMFAIAREILAGTERILNIFASGRNSVLTALRNGDPLAAMQAIGGVMVEYPAAYMELVVGIGVEVLKVAITYFTTVLGGVFDKLGLDPKLITNIGDAANTVLDAGKKALDAGFDATGKVLKKFGDTVSEGVDNTVGAIKAGTETLEHGAEVVVGELKNCCKWP
jgi:hypothetical protein